MIYLLSYLIICWFVGFGFGSNRMLGPWRAFAYCILLSPITGLIVILSYQTKTKRAIEKEQLRLQKENITFLKRQQQNKEFKSTLPLERLSKLKEQGLITEEEFLILASRSFGHS
jgi:hypothetical protein